MIVCKMPDIFFGEQGRLFGNGSDGRQRCAPVCCDQRQETAKAGHPRPFVGGAHQAGPDHQLSLPAFCLGGWMERPDHLDDSVVAQAYRDRRPA